MIKKIRAQQLHEKAVDVVRRYVQCEVELIEVLEELRRTRAFYVLGYPSLFQYAVKGLNLSEPVARIYINVAGKTLEVPALKEEIRKGTISVAKAVRLTAVMTASNQEHWLKLAQGSKRQLERAIALASPEKAIQERVCLRRLGKTVRVELSLGVSEHLMLKLRRAQDILSQKYGRNISLEETLETVTETYLAKEDPVAKAKRHMIRKGLCPGKVQEKEHGEPGARKPIRVSLKHSLNLKHEGQCSYVDKSGQRCEQRRYLHIHHIRPVAEGGTNTLENLTLLCSGHHKVVHTLDQTDGPS